VRSLILRLSNLATRVLAALVGIPIILLLAMAGGFYFFVFILVLASLGLWEFYALARAKGAHPQTVTGTVLGVLLAADFMFVRLRDSVLTFLDKFGISVPMPSMAQYFLILFLLFTPLVLGLELFRRQGSAMLNIAVTLLGSLYVSLFFGSLLGIRELFVPEDFPVSAHFPVAGAAVSDEIAATIYGWGGKTVIVIFVSIWVCDSAAYFVGRAFGKRKLFERISPNKTWEGAVGGFLAAVGGFVLGASLALPYLTLPQAAVCGSVVGLFGQLGDLAESMLKRDAGVKDSSNLIPGHGGVLDRFDSLMFVSPLLFFYLDFILF
jgi:phosphatidate cytidylyltransferase